jgi:hypothetical protein
MGTEVFLRGLDFSGGDEAPLGVSLAMGTDLPGPRPEYVRSLNFGNLQVSDSCRPSVDVVLACE